MINLIISGGSPTICKELAGHANIDISSHYYSNISTFVECVTLERFCKSKGGKAEITGEKCYPLSHPVNAFRVTGGCCGSHSAQSGDVRDCMKIVDANGYIGECSSCPHFWSDDKGIRLKFLNSKVGKQSVVMDSQYLLRMIDIVRKGLGYSKDISSAILRLQSSCNHYGHCLWNNLYNENPESLAEVSE